MKCRKIFALLLSLCMVMSTFVALPVQAEDLLEISVGSVTAEPGATITVPVSVANNANSGDPDYPGITAMTLNFKYDADVLTLDRSKSKQGEALSSLDMTKPGGTSQGDLNFVWDSTDADNSEGVILNLVFTVSADAAPGEYAIELSVVDCCDFNMDDIEYTTVDGIVTIPDAEEPGDDEEEPIGDKLTIIVGSVTAEPGDEITVPVIVVNNTYGDPDYPGIAAMTLNFKYDADVLTLNRSKSKQGEALAYLDMTKPGGTSQGDVNFVWDSTDADNSEGVILNLVFTVSEYAKPGVYPIEVSVIDCVDYNMDDLDYEIRNGKVTIPSGAVEPPAHDHIFVETITTPATCGEDGLKTCICMGCGYAYTEGIPATGNHDYKGVVIMPATCIETGVLAYRCVCGEYAYTEAIPATGIHTWDNGRVTLAPTQTSNGIRTYTCRSCGEKKTESIPKIPEDLTISVGKVTAEPGETITIPVSIANNANSGDPDYPGIMGLALRFKYDADFLAYDYRNTKRGDALSRLEFAKPGSSFTEGNIYFLWDSVNADNSEGVILNMVFTVSEDAIPGTTYAIEVSTVDCLDYNCDDIETDVVNGKVIISGAEPIGDELTFIVGSKTAKPGETITIPVSVVNNANSGDPDYPGICAMTLNFKYDANVLTLDSRATTQGDALSSLDMYKPSGTSQGDVNFVWDSTDADNTEGVILNMVFTVAENTVPGEYGIELSVVDCCDFNLADIETDVRNGKIIIPGGTEPPAHEHSYTEEITTPATCGEDGVKRFICACGDTYTEVIPATGNHDYIGVITTPATHTEEGEMTYTCTVCGDTYTEIIEKTPDHEYDGGVITTPATCGAEGVMTYTCICGDTYTEVIPATGNHTWNDGIITLAPTCVGTGIKAYDCTVCGERKTEVLPATGVHTWNKGMITVQPTKTTEGEWLYKCIVCGEEKTEIINVVLDTDDITNVTVSDATVRTGKEITVPVAISKNKGILGLKMTLEYNTDALTWIGATKGDALLGLEFTHSEEMGKMPVIFIWDGIEADDSNGEIVLLTFKAFEDAVPGEYKISAKIMEVCDNDLNDVIVCANSGVIEVKDYTPGDIDDDGEIDTRDVVLMRRYVVNDYDVEIVEEAADVDKDGIIGIKDIILIRRYIVGGYGVEL